MLRKKRDRLTAKRNNATLRRRGLCLSRVIEALEARRLFSYVVHDFGAGNSPNGINNLGEVVGTFGLYLNGSIHSVDSYFGLPAYAINDSGEVVGGGSVGGEFSSAYAYVTQTNTSTGATVSEQQIYKASGGDYYGRLERELLAVDNQSGFGLAAGYYNSNTGTQAADYHGLFWNGTTYPDTEEVVHSIDYGIQYFGGPYADIVGTATLPTTGTFKAFVNTTGSIQYLDIGDGGNGAATAINRNKQVVGYATFYNSSLAQSLNQPFFYTIGGQVVQIPLPSGYISGKALAINDKGYVVGTMTNANGSVAAFIWHATSPTSPATSLNTVQDGGFTLATATGINNSNQIIGTYKASDGSTHGYLMSPGSGPYSIVHEADGIDASDPVNTPASVYIDFSDPSGVDLSTLSSTNLQIVNTQTSAVIPLTYTGQISQDGTGGSNVFYTALPANGQWDYTYNGSYSIELVPSGSGSLGQASQVLNNLGQAFASQIYSTGFTVSLTVPHGTISGTVYDDSNGDGSRDDAEAGMSNVEVYIDTQNNGTYDVSHDPTAFTDTGGSYTFTEVPGNYIVREVTPDGYSAAQGAVGWSTIVAANVAATGDDFGNTAANGVSGRVYTTSSGALPGVRVYLDYANTGVFDPALDPSSVTDAAGNYSIGPIKDGEFWIRIDPVPGYTEVGVSSVTNVAVANGGIDFFPEEFHQPFGYYHGLNFQMQQASQSATASSGGDWTIMPIAPNTNGANITGINDNNIVVLNTTTDGGGEYFYNGIASAIPGLPQSATKLEGINNRNQVIGEVTQSGQTVPFVYNLTTGALYYIQATDPYGASIHPVAINNAGLVLLTSDSLVGSTFQYHSYIYDAITNSGLVELPYPEAFSLNDRGELFVTVPGGTHDDGLLYNYYTGGVQPVTVSSFSNPDYLQINNEDEVAAGLGNSYPPTGSAVADLNNNGKVMWSFSGLLFEDFNDSGTVVGYSYGSSPQAFLSVDDGVKYSGSQIGRAYLCLGLLPKSTPWSRLTDATVINNRDVIAGTGVLSGQQELFVMMPPVATQTTVNQTYINGVDVASGSVRKEQTDVTLPGLFPLTVSRTYDSLSSNDSGMGAGWSFTYDDSLTLQAAGITWHTGAGRDFSFTQNGSDGFTTPAGVYGTMSVVSGGMANLSLPNGGYVFHDKSGTIFAFDSGGALTSITDHNGNVQSVTRSSDQMIVQNQTSGQSLTFSYDATHHITAISDSAGRTWNYTYSSFIVAPETVTLVVNGVQTSKAVMGDTLYELRQVTSPSDARTKVLITGYGYEQQTLAYAPDPKPTVLRLTSWTDADRSVTTYAYDDNGRISKQTAPMTQEKTTYAYLLNGTESKETDPRGLTTTYHFDLAGEIFEIDYPDKSVSKFTWNSQLLTSDTDGLGNMESFKYDSLGDVTQSTDRAGKVTKYGYIYLNNTAGPLRELKSKTNPLQKTWTYAYDAKGNLTLSTDPLQNSTYTTYNSIGEMTSQRDARLSKTTYQYNNAGQVTAVYTPLPSTMGYSYDAYGNRTSDVDANGHTTSFTYDLLGHQLTQTQVNLGYTTTTNFDNLGLVTSVTDPRNLTTSYTYDKDHRLTQTINPDTTVKLFNYDGDGNIVRTYDEVGARTDLTYDGRNRPLTVSVYPYYAPVAGTTVTGLTSTPQVTQTLRDAAGNVTLAEDPLGNYTRYQYDANGRLKTVIDPLKHTTSYGYDAMGNRTSETDPLGHTTQYVFDADNRQTAMIDALNHKSSIIYDADSDVSETIDANNSAVLYAYDVLDRRTSMTDALLNRTIYGYDSAGNETSSLDPLNHKTTYEYDSMDRQTKATDALGVSHSTTFAYDQDNNITQSIDPLGNTTTFTFDNRNRKSTQTDATLTQVTSWTYDGVGNVRTMAQVSASGNRVNQYAYDADQHVVEQIDPVNQSSRLASTYLYDLDNRLIKSIDALGNGTTYAYDAASRQTLITDALNNRTSIAYDNAGNKISVKDPLNHVQGFAYDAINRLTVTIDPIGNRTSTTYDAVGDVIAVKDPRAHRTSYVYDADHRRTLVIDPLLEATTTDYDAAGNIIQVTDPDGNTTTYAYDADNRRITATDALTTGITRTVYDAAGNVIQSIDPRGNLTSYQYDRDNRMTLTIDPNNTASNPDRSSVAYDNFSEVTLTTDQNGNTTAFAYDANGRRTLVTDPTHAKTSSVYDAAGRLVQTIDPNLNKTTYVYDKDNRLSIIIDPMGFAKTSTYDAAGNVVKSTDARNLVTTFVYDADNRKVSVIDPLGEKTSYNYDPDGQVAVMTDPLQRKTTYTYDIANRRIQVTDPLGNTTTTTYDAAGNVVNVTDALKNSTTYQYDVDNRQTAAINALGNITRTSYDTAGNVVGIQDASGNSETYGYDKDNRKTTDTNQLGFADTLNYDNNGNVTSELDRNSRLRTFTYDGDNRLTAEVWLSSTNTLVNTLSYSFDPAGRLTHTSDSASSESYSYDADGRLTKADNANTAGAPRTVLSYGYDNDSNRTSMTDTDNGVLNSTTSYGYDQANRLTQMTVSGATVAPATIQFKYDLASELSATSRTSGSSSPVTTTFTYDADSRVTQQQDTYSGSPLASYQWQYDSAGRVTSITDVAGTHDYSYDAIGQEIAAINTDTSQQRDEAYNYDQTGNRTNAGVTTGPNNQLLSDGTYNYTYDNEGNRTSRTNIQTGAVTLYNWDYRNRLTEVIQKTAGGVVIEDSIYTYDTNDQRITTSISSNGGSPVVTHDVYDGQNLLLQFAGAATTPSHHYINGLQTDQHFADDASAVSLQWLLQDNQGSVRAVVSTSGVLINQITYNSFGLVSHQTAGVVLPTFGYTGQQMDGDTGLEFYRMRYFDPGVGRFISEDPLTFLAGDVNLTRYVLNSPMNGYDPTGEIGGKWGVTVHTSAAAGGAVTAIVGFAALTVATGGGVLVLGGLALALGTWSAVGNTANAIDAANGGQGEVVPAGPISAIAQVAGAGETGRAWAEVGDSAILLTLGGGVGAAVEGASRAGTFVGPGVRLLESEHNLAVAADEYEYLSNLGRALYQTGFPREEGGSGEGGGNNEAQAPGPAGAAQNQFEHSPPALGPTANYVEFLQSEQTGNFYVNYYDQKGGTLLGQLAELSYSAMEAVQNAPGPWPVPASALQAATPAQTETTPARGTGPQITSDVSSNGAESVEAGTLNQGFDSSRPNLGNYANQLSVDWASLTPSVASDSTAGQSSGASEPDINAAGQANLTYGLLSSPYDGGAALISSAYSAIGISAGKGGVSITEDWCFLTTACVKSRGLPDDCLELTVLRGLRDNYMKKSAAGRALIEEYYQIAPEMCRRIERRSDAASIWNLLYGEITQAVELTLAGRYQAAVDFYRGMVLRLLALTGSKREDAQSLNLQTVSLATNRFCDVQLAL